MARSEDALDFGMPALLTAAALLIEANLRPRHQERAILLGRRLKLPPYQRLVRVEQR